MGQFCFLLCTWWLLSAYLRARAAIKYKVENKTLVWRMYIPILFCSLQTEYEQLAALPLIRFDRINPVKNVLQDIYKKFTSGPFWTSQVLWARIPHPASRFSAGAVPGCTVCFQYVYGIQQDSHGDFPVRQAIGFPSSLVVMPQPY